MRGQAFAEIYLFVRLVDYAFFMSSGFMIYFILILFHFLALRKHHALNLFSEKEYEFLRLVRFACVRVIFLIFYIIILFLSAAGITRFI